MLNVLPPIPCFLPTLCPRSSEYCHLEAKQTFCFLYKKLSSPLKNHLNALCYTLLAVDTEMAVIELYSFQRFGSRIVEPSGENSREKRKIIWIYRMDPDPDVQISYNPIRSPTPYIGLISTRIQIHEL